MHGCVRGHMRPHAPQFPARLSSVSHPSIVGLQSPQRASQRVIHLPCSQKYTRRRAGSPVPHRWLQPPQLSRSVIVFTHRPPHSASPTGHDGPASIRTSTTTGRSSAASWGVPASVPPRSSADTSTAGTSVASTSQRPATHVVPAPHAPPQGTSDTAGASTPVSDFEGTWAGCSEPHAARSARSRGRMAGEGTVPWSRVSPGETLLTPGRHREPLPDVIRAFPTA